MSKLTTAQSLTMTPSERRAAWALTGIYATRMLGLFLLLPVLVLHVRDLPGGSEALASFAVGAYGLAQALLQIPFGMLSDRLGRRPVIVLGFALFFLGSLIGWKVDTVFGIISARLLQGAGAVSAAVTALLADVTRPEIRTRAMALIGISIGLCFMLSLLIAPPLEGLVGVPGIFAIMALLAAAAIVALFAVPSADMRPAIKIPALADIFSKDLVIGYGGVFALHFALLCAFVSVPQLLQDHFGMAQPTHWRVYAAVFAASLVVTLPLLFAIERSAPARITRLTVAILIGALCVMAASSASLMLLCVGFTLFFGAFNLLEARLPASVSLAAEPSLRGAALGVFATAQVLGAFAGAESAGLVLKAGQGLGAPFAIAALVCVFWLARLLFLRETSA